MSTNLGFIGTGRIAGAVVKGLCTTGIKNTVINLSPRNERISLELEKEFSNVNRLESNQLVLDMSDVVFISVPPKASKGILRNLKFRETHTVVSFVPFLIMSELTEAVDPAGIISRAIPLPTVVNHVCPVPVLNPDKSVVQILSYIGQPIPVKNEDELHVLWTLTGFIAPFYDLLKELGTWAVSNGVNETTANKYIAEMIYSLISSTRKTRQIDFDELVKHAATPNGMNEQAVKEINEKDTHEIYKTAADNLLRRFTKNL